MLGYSLEPNLEISQSVPVPMRVLGLTTGMLLMCSPVVFTTAFPAMTTATATTLSAVSTVALIGGTTMMSIQAQKASMKYQQQQANSKKNNSKCRPKRQN